MTIINTGTQGKQLLEKTKKMIENEIERAK